MNAIENARTISSYLSKIPYICKDACPRFGITLPTRFHCTEGMKSKLNKEPTTSLIHKTKKSFIEVLVNVIRSKGSETHFYCNNIEPLIAEFWSEVISPSIQIQPTNIKEKQIMDIGTSILFVSFFECKPNMSYFTRTFNETPVFTIHTSSFYRRLFLYHTSRCTSPCYHNNCKKVIHSILGYITGE
jgi:hypothetical protein